MLGFLPGFDSDNGYHPSVAKLREWFPAVHNSDLAATALIVLVCWLLFRGARKSADRV